MKKTNIYVLKLNGGNYYVGKTSDLQSRIDSHFKGKGSAWTKLHKPLKVDKIMRKASPFDEDKVVKEYMNKYGIHCVRGGAYSECELKPEQISYLKKEINNAMDNCLRCGRDSHFVQDCYATTDVNGKSLTNKNLGKKRSRDEQQKFYGCERCGRDSHLIDTCYASTYIDGEVIEDSYRDDEVEGEEESYFSDSEEQDQILENNEESYYSDDQGEENYSYADGYDYYD